MIAQENVHLVKLPPMRVASVCAYSSTPERDAWEKLLNWARRKGVLIYPEGQRIFGFNNPDPFPGSPKYGYEFWITVGDDVQGDEDVEMKNIPAATYAVLHCYSLQTIGEDWKKLVRWVEVSPYQIAAGQCLEEHVGPLEVTEAELELDLMLPVYP
jgi:effector-binding domain-containing protein